MASGDPVLDAALALAIEAHRAGRSDAAQLYQAAAALAPSQEAGLTLAAHRLVAEGCPDLAAELLAGAHQPPLLLLHAEILLGLEQAGPALGVLQRLAGMLPHDPAPLLGQGLALRRLGRHGEAVEVVGRAVRLAPENPRNWTALAEALEAAGRRPAALAVYERVVELAPTDSESHFRLGLARCAAEDLAAAVAAFQAAADLAPERATLWANLGAALHGLKRFDAAEAASRRSLDLDPDVASAHLNLALSLWSQHRLDEAIEHAMRASALQPGNAEAHCAEGMMRIQLGDLPLGFEKHEWRFEAYGRPRYFGLDGQVWRGEDLTGKTILVYGEQGFGDTLQFVRFAAAIKARGAAEVVMSSQPQLVRLLATAPGLDRVLSADAPPPPYDCHIPLMSAPAILGTTLDQLGGTVPYLSADPTARAAWGLRLGNDGRLKVGLVWAGNGRPNDPRSAAVDKDRSLHLDRLAPLAAVADARFISLQIGPPAAQLRTPPAGLALEDPTADLGDWADTAALVDCLDLVIGVDTAVAHLTGSLGKPIWMMSRHNACWRWQLGRDDSPWYPSMRVYFQPRHGEWAPVIERVAADLAQMLEDRRQTAESRF